MRTTQRDEAALLTRVAEMESLYDAGRFAEAVTAAEPMCGLLDSTYLRGKVRLRLAQAYIELGKTELGKASLAEARRDLEAIHDSEMIVECMAADAAIACFQQRPEAVELAAKALVAFRSLRNGPNTLEVRILSHLGSSQLVAGRTSDAIRAFEEAMDRADPVVDMRRLGRVLGNAAIAHKELGDLHMAVHCSTRAIALFETLHDVLSLAIEENNLGCYLLRLGDVASAHCHLERAMDLCEHADLKSTRGLVLLSMCELCLARASFHQAITYADSAIEVGEGLNEAWSVANAHMWKGRVVARLGDDVGVDREFEIAVDILTGSGLTERLIGCHTLYGELLEKRGDLPRAYEQLKRAFRLRHPR